MDKKHLNATKREAQLKHLDGGKTSGCNTKKGAIEPPRCNAKPTT